MKITTTPIKDLLIIEPRVFADNRGYFFESFNKNSFTEAGITDEFVQDNQSKSSKGTLRGLHFQAPPFAQGKLVRVIQGAVLDIAVDIRKCSPTFGQYFTVELTAENQLQFWIPPGFAHGFLTLEDETIFTYKCTNFYNKASEGGIIWNDPDVNINWGTTDVLVSEKDMILPKLSEFTSPF
ncbi:dTDP-4-dehydrorhamnose 3,5-epimerase [Solitalea canadensis]|uniref:dTDP-4-dehydrorhamnose 3,5-epimerase n=1 Tax=Solitalea canadensis (strain ATCC 29591 / DSM 3403 / JCM 21819 / LMG 8368 / NBRC 15130 / NCIMB 12057 / USAM 9D) TaxID=929556 RepID=H8KX27_SOLCM|nr:dTDP-4-dehydrorhamnose 3,5-epimerase [Solitalea canadensis]AFD08356.1 dTDP-4-dehydrorhamnose 3,5-epimerase [Solitalea canadensis DSM 3403]